MKDINWKNLPFQYNRTDYNLRCYFKDGKWGELEVSDSENVTISMASTCLHYGQGLFEGLKAFRTKEGKINIFRLDQNSKRLNFSARGIMMPEVPEEIFTEAVVRAVKLNEKYIPPYGHGASLYIRPFLIGLGPEVGVKPAKEYLFMVFVTPVGPYFKEGFKPVDIMICRSHDRAAPLGTGCYKVGGNYAASLTSLQMAKDAGFATTLYLDAKEKKYIDEAGPANFFGIKNGTYITPDSKSILKSITNLSLQELVKDMGLKVENRPVPVEELETFEEVGFCGTAAIITSIRKIVDPDKNKIYEFVHDNQPGKICTELYHKLIAMQYGEVPDKFNWNTVLD